jgi:voltage-gated potassium channel
VFSEHEKVTLKRVVQDTSHPAGFAFDIFIQALIVISLISFCIGTLPDISETTERVLWYQEVIVVGIFTIEYVLRAYFSEPISEYTFSFFGVIDLTAIVPFYAATGLDLRAVRVFRLLRVFRVVKLMRYTSALDRFYRAFKRVQEEFIIFLSLCGAVIFVASVGIYYFENPAQPDAFASILHSMWWAVATITTVGYGDVYPVTVGGKLFTSIILMTGLGIVSVPAGLLASALTETYEEDRARSDRHTPDL